MDGQCHGLEAVIDFACYILIFGVTNCPEERSMFIGPVLPRRWGRTSLRCHGAVMRPKVEHLGIDIGNHGQYRGHSQYENKERMHLVYTQVRTAF